MARKVVYDSSDPEQVRAAEKQEQDVQNDIRYILKEPRGRRWLYEFIFNTCHVELPSFVPGDEQTTAFNEGGRAVGQRLLGEIRDAWPAMYIKMLEENQL